MSSRRARLGLKERVIGGARRLLWVFLYLWALLTLFALHESIVLAKHEVGDRGYRSYGLALVNAWVLAKVMLVSEELDLAGRWLGGAPLIYRILSRAGFLAVALMAAYAVEGVLLGLWQGKAIRESFPRIGGGSIADIVSVGVVLGVALVPFCAFRAIERALGPGVLRSTLLGRPSDPNSRGGRRPGPNDAEGPAV